MGYDVFRTRSRCSHGRILRALENCEHCIEAERERAYAKAGPEQAKALVSRDGRTRYEFVARDAFLELLPKTAAEADALPWLNDVQEGDDHSRLYRVRGSYAYFLDLGSIESGRCGLMHPQAVLRRVDCDDGSVTWEQDEALGAEFRKRFGGRKRTLAAARELAAWLEQRAPWGCPRGEPGAQGPAGALPAKLVTTGAPAPKIDRPLRAETRLPMARAYTQHALWLQDPGAEDRYGTLYRVRGSWAWVLFWRDHPYVLRPYNEDILAGTVRWEPQDELTAGLRTLGGASFSALAEWLVEKAPEPEKLGAPAIPPKLLVERVRQQLIESIVKQIRECAPGTMYSHRHNLFADRYEFYDARGTLMVAVPHNDVAEAASAVATLEARGCTNVRVNRWDWANMCVELAWTEPGPASC